MKLVSFGIPKLLKTIDREIVVVRNHTDLETICLQNIPCTLIDGSVTTDISSGVVFNDADDIRTHFATLPKVDYSLLDADKVFDLRTIKKVMIGTPRFPSNETKDIIVVEPGKGTYHGEGVARGHLNAALEALKYDEPVLLFENDAYPLETYTDLIPKPTEERDVIWLGFTKNQNYRKVDDNYSVNTVPIWGAHAVLLVTEAGKNHWKAAAETLHAIDENACKIYTGATMCIKNVPMFCQLPITGGNWFNYLTFFDVDHNPIEAKRRKLTLQQKSILPNIIGKWEQYNDGNYCCIKEFLDNGLMNTGEPWSIENGTISFSEHIVKVVDDMLIGRHEIHKVNLKYTRPS